ncbi:MAG: Phosphopantetheine adenylyltransferase [candidate division CPR2 bacterium GW2011_GWC1_39_9]|uniref:Phosphopantetheine adenylyltransferase n=1 Tax=candidate division CPR2 bacterium GW2011_GWC2_39_10 TaxID=1618345 RepID=A0A0G0P4Y4_UNCC2|nr:MAG: Phosphopantetheine adenylyltransferase [candidate division CPR2 bacterium GW2011_GWC2_39_10]KKR34481.1 MAG: Phosphopantetheine adenylyltransferase [candidate division CPR2 bacterium GW2011_GWC1_39_9]
MVNPVFPGSFCPPTYGHLDIATRASRIFERFTIVCSNSDEKSYWFTQDKCMQLWDSYKLPKNVDVISFGQARERGLVGSELLMIRGIRGGEDYAYESEIMKYNHEKFEIDDFLYLISNPDLMNVSASRAREMAEQPNLLELSRVVSPMTVTALLEYALNIQNLFLVVGRPGAGKSTILEEICRQDSSSRWINTDNYSDILAPMAAEHFVGENIVQLAIERPKELSALIGEQWLSLLARNLDTLRGTRNVFVEVAYGLAEDKKIYRFVGGKVLHMSCSDPGEQRQRILDRQTPELMPFFDIIPDLSESRQITERERLVMTELETDDDITKTVSKFFERLEVPS